MDFQPFLQNTSLLLNNYIDVKNALVSSNSKAATKTISTLFNLVKKEENFAQKAELLKATEKLFKIGITWINKYKKDQWQKLLIKDLGGFA